MKKKNIIWIAVVVVIVVWLYSGYNGLVSKDEAVINKWAAVEADYQRRSDLIPNLVATVKGYAEHESSTLESVTADAECRRSDRGEPAGLSGGSERG